MYFEITKREIFVALAITLILIGLGSLISSAIKNSISESNEIYYKALKINDSNEQFEYAINTNVGYTLAQGTVKAVNGVSIDDIEGTYFKIRKVKEIYTKHYREVPHTKTDSKGHTTTYYTTESYWTWDYSGEEEFNTEKFDFMGRVFDYGTIGFNNEEYKETKDVDYYTRYKYYIIPFEFQGCLFTYINNNTINRNEFIYDTSIEQIINSKEEDESSSSVIFWGIWIFFIIILDMFYISFENKYLEDKK